ncbi:MAG: cyclic nucleotide-binding domain-containing protein [Deltaproteobacteria bacterium]|nr:cyclic nucleotide-binding domain-containing protein [Deltaproteobacteria bacterium]
MNDANDRLRRVAAMESRSDPRVGVELRVDVASDQFSGALPAMTRDLSIGGACIATSSPLATQSIRQLVLHLPQGPLRVEAQGCWQAWNPATSAMLTGVAFKSVTPSTQDAIWDHVLDVSKELARFVLRSSELRDIGIDGAMSLAQVSRLCAVRPGAAIFQEGSGNAASSQSLFILREGSVLIRTRLRDVVERDIAVVQPGELLCGLALFTSAAHAETAVARSACRLIEIDERAFLYLMQARPWIAQKVAFAAARSYARRLRGALETLTLPH